VVANKKNNFKERSNTRKTRKYKKKLPEQGQDIPALEN